MDWQQLASQLRKPTGDEGIHTAFKMNESNGRLYELMFEAIISSDIVTKNVLEIGFGNGKHFPELITKCKCEKVTGLDFSEDMCKAAIDNNTELVNSNQLEIVCGDLLGNTLPPASYDFIFGLNIIYFLEPLETFTIEFKKLLKPGGILAFGYRPESSMKLYPFSQYGFRLYSEEELNAFMNSQQFSVVKTLKNNLHRISVDGNEYPTEDICVLYRYL